MRRMQVCAEERVSSEIWRREKVKADHESEEDGGGREDGPSSEDLDERSDEDSTDALGGLVDTRSGSEFGEGVGSSEAVGGKSRDGTVARSGTRRSVYGTGWRREGDRAEGENVQKLRIEAEKVNFDSAEGSRRGVERHTSNPSL